MLDDWLEMLNLMTLHKGYGYQFGTRMAVPGALYGSADPSHGTFAGNAQYVDGTDRSCYSGGTDACASYSCRSYI